MSPFFEENSEPYEVADGYAAMRKNFFAQAKAGAEAEDAAGLMMETGWEDSCFALVARPGEGASQYFSSGRRNTIAGKQAEAIEAANALLEKAGTFDEHFKPISEFPLPEPGRTHFYRIRDGRVQAARFREDDLLNDRAPLSPLYQEAAALIGILRSLTQEQPDIQL